MTEFDADPTNKTTGLAAYCRRCAAKKAEGRAKVMAEGGKG